MTGLRRVSSSLAVLLVGAAALPGCGGGRDENAASFGSFGPSPESDTDAASDPTMTLGDTGESETNASGSGPSSSAGSGADTDTDSETAGPTGGATQGETEGETEGVGNDTESADTDESTGSAGGESTGGAPLTDDPFDPAACEGAPLTVAAADALLGGLPRSVLSSAVIQVRTRTCPAGACGAWTTNEGWMIHYLTWSGGVKTRWKDLLADMDLVLFDDNGTIRISMQHETFGAGGYPDDDGVVYDLPPVAQNYPHVRAYNEFPDNQYDYIDLDYQVSDGTLVLGEDCAVWTANPFGIGMPHVQQYGALFRW